MEQKFSLFGLQYKEGPTVILLYKTAKEALDHQIQNHEATVDTLSLASADVFCDDSVAMPTPLNLPQTFDPKKRRGTNSDILSSMTTIVPQKDDMKYAREFKEENLKTHKRMNWKACYDKGLNEGYFFT
ncbi:hypothetical protein BD770DRAFT_376417 [Pilaira anomala]|nr:hypothetical protein BD770DRAFT_376417 [Pilaira anomala]